MGASVGLSEDQPLAVRMTGIGKSFGGVHALEDVDFEVRAGEIHALVGENGAGKSTLLKVLLGVHEPDAGGIELFGQPLAGHTPHEARERGIAMIFQELSLIPTMTVAQNIFLAREPRTPSGLVDDRAIVERTRKLLGSIGVNLDPRLRVSRLSTGQRQLTEIAKALSQDARVLIMDEPTSALSAAETDLLFELLATLRDRGVSIVYVSHRMDEIFQVADRVTALRNARRVVTDDVHALGPEGVISAIVGRRVRAFDRQTRNVSPQSPPLLDVLGLTGTDLPEDATFVLQAGEILGIAGLMGSGRSELARTLAGLDPMTAGEVRLRGEPVTIDSPVSAIEAGLAMLPEDRSDQGLVLQHSVAANITLPILKRLTSRSHLIDDDRLTEVVEQMVEQLRIKTESIRTPVRKLSGGNQQKVVLAKWLSATPDVLILDEPTAGVDIGSKAEILGLIRAVADEGKGIILISSELPELLALSDRILIMHEGRLDREIPGEEIGSWMPPDADPGERIAMAQQELQHRLQGVAA